MNPMSIDSFFPSKYLEAADLQGKRLTVRVTLISTEKFGDSNRPVLYFQGIEKGLVLKNKTNAKAIKEIAGTGDMNRWIGISMVLYPTTADYQGRRYDVIRIDRLTGQDTAGDGGQRHGGGGEVNN
jgi:hypothetical protein